MKKSMLKGLALACGLAAISAPAVAETVLKLGSVAPSGSPWGKWATGVAAKIEEVSGGELKIELLLDAQAGDEQTVLRQTSKGRLDIAFVSNVPLTLLSQEMAIPSAAYLFDSPEQGTCVTYEHLSDTLGGIMEGAGVVPLTWMEVGHYVLFSKEPVSSPADLAGKKMRIAPSIADAALAKAWGVQGVPMGTSDAIPALQTGTVDAAWFPTLFGIGIGTHKVAPHVTVTNHARLIGTVAVSGRTWAKLSDQEKQWLGVFTAAGPQLTQGILGAEPALLGQLEGAGVPVKHLSAEEGAVWKAAADGVLAAIIEEAGGDAQAVADRIAQAKAACGS
ncbi:TRAP transporter substrate-binding protein DctP [Ruegeria sp. 1NDH52C]|uniref:TRAP transporter substrate-binding protein DctP n=1 Tax=Ruegeria alba TaxID=2916756 RepID=A0ABS9NYR5_9RHOB|nr:TRAP transporter substrate-binding protein DctP [Ruegeria alba]MCG6559161.1 TRAP transporter substrate-binding protein DctP [Ruegeria alba]